MYLTVISQGHSNTSSTQHRPRVLAIRRRRHLPPPTAAAAAVDPTIVPPSPSPSPPGHGPPPPPPPPVQPLPARSAATAPPGAPVVDTDEIATLARLRLGLLSNLTRQIPDSASFCSIVSNSSSD
ncbi:hypothetical protein NL676_015618 [Syzygium grande]|nr:hypothetical protein NL676_015618 [Syzygium grande]